MPDNPTLPLTAANVVVGGSLCDVKSKQDIVDLVVENVVVLYQAVANSINNGIYKGPNEPTGDNFGKLWQKETGTGGAADPRGVGIVVNGQYVILPIPADQTPPIGVPAGGIIMWGSATAPEGWSIFPGTPPVGVSYITRN